MNNLSQQLHTLSQQQKRDLLAKLLQKETRETGSDLFPNQQRLWFLNMLTPGYPASVAAAYTLYGEVHQTRLIQCIDEIAQRHDNLRTTFVEVDGRPLKVVAQDTHVEITMVPCDSEDKKEQLAHQLAIQLRRPFDLAKDPLIRVTLFTLAPQKHVLLLVMHQMIADEQAVHVFLDELSICYQQQSDGVNIHLPPLPVRYTDVVREQYDWLQKPEAQEQLTYWRKQLAGAPAALALPTDSPRPTVQSFRGASCQRQFSSELQQALHQLSQQEGTTPFMTLLTAFQALLLRYSGQDDLVVGTLTSTRREKLQSLIGNFTNTLVLRGDLSGDPSFIQALQRARNVCEEAYAHQEIPFERLIEALQPERSLGHSPLFQILFAYNKEIYPHLAFAHLQSEPLQLEVETTQVDLALTITENDQGLMALLVYNPDLFERETIEQFLAHYERLLWAALEQPHVPISRLPLLSAPEQAQLLLQWGQGPQVAIPSVSAQTLFEQQVERTPEAVAVRFGEQSLSYRQLNQRANQLADSLQQRGVGAEVRVGICVQRSLELLVGLLGVWKAGGAYVPLDPQYPAERLGFMLQDAQVALVLSQQAVLDRLPEQSAPVVVLEQFAEELARCSVENPLKQQVPGNLAYVLYTSGSTGTPKGAMIHHAGLVNYLCWCVQSYETSQRNGSLVHSSIAFDLTVTGLYTPLLCGHTVTLVNEEKDALSVALSEGGFSFVKLTPAHLELLTQWLPSEAAPNAAARFVVGGEALIGEALAYWKHSAPETYIVNEYGPTETVVGCCTFEIAASEVLPGAVPIGRPIPNISLYVLDAQMQPVPRGVAGELFIGGEGVARGYFQRPDLTAERFVPDPFSSQPGTRLYQTGDLVRYRLDGQLEFLGRLDQQVKVRGYRIELGEIEAAIRTHEVVQECVVIVREDQPGDRRLVAYLVPERNSQFSMLKLREHLEHFLPDYMIPAAFVALEHLPLTSHGKVDRNALPLPSDERPEIESAYVAPRTVLEKEIAEAFAEVLGIEKVGIHDNFFDLGAHSLRVAQLSARLSKIYRVNPPVQQFFEVPTVAGLARTIEAYRQQPEKPHAIHMPNLEAEVVLDPTITPEGLPWAEILNPAHIFLTGSTGFLGAFLLEELLQKTTADVYCLVRAATVDEGFARIQQILKLYRLWSDTYRHRIIPVLGDLALPRFGLSEQQFIELARVIDAIYHSGAKVNFIYPYSALKPVNVLGTQEVLRLACCERVKVVHHVSALDVFVSHDKKDHRVMEEDLVHPGGHPYGYVQSKWVGEKLVSTARERGLPTCIYRPWLITGHSQTGATHTTDLICVVLKGSVQLGMIADDGTEFNVMPVDYVSQGIVYLSQQRSSLGKIFHFVNQSPIELRDAFNGLSRFGYDLKVVPFSTWREQALNVDQSNALYPVVPLYRDQTEYPEFKIDCTNTLAALQGSGIVCPPVNEEHLHKCLSFLVDIGFLSEPTSHAQEQEAIPN